MVGVLEAFKYRLMDHKHIVPTAAAEKLYQAFGGFDLDDKVISDLHFIRDSSGARRLASFVWRQPTGPQEFALMFPHLDEDTLTRLLGSETQFAERFQALSSAASDLVSEARLGRYPTAKINITAGELDKLTRQEKIIKYVSLVANGNRKQARRYVEGLGDYNTQSFFDDVEKAIFTIDDLGRTNELGTMLGISDDVFRSRRSALLGSNFFGENATIPELNNIILNSARQGEFRNSPESHCK
jgi:hypothetical protein